MKTPLVFAPEKGKISIETIDLPPLNSNQILFQNQLSAISPGTELAWLHHKPNTPGHYPFYPGYSACGVVSEIGEAVEGLQIGQRVVTNVRHTAYAVVEADRCIPIPDSLPDADAAVFRLGAIALQGIHKAQIQLGWEVAVIGLGPIGNLAGQIARAAGATHVEGVDPVAWRRDLALQCGFDAVTDSTENISRTAGFDAVIEAAGVPQTVPFAFHIAKRFGHVVLLASTRGETNQVNFYRDVHKKGLTIFGAHESVRPSVDDHLSFITRQRDENTVIKLLASGRLKTGPLVSDVVSFEDADQAYERLNKRDEELMLIAFRW